MEKIGFFKIKPIEEWSNVDTWWIYQTDHTIVALNVMPSWFGHVIIFSKNQLAHDLASQDDQGDYILSTEERKDLWEIQHNLSVLMKDVLSNRERIIKVYKNRSKNVELMAKIPWCKDRLEEMILFWKNLSKSTSFGDLFENRGPHSGRMIATYHFQYVPQYANYPISTQDALSDLLLSKVDTGDKSISKDELLHRKEWIVYEDDTIQAILYPNPSSFGHVAIIPQNDLDPKAWSVDQITDFYQSLTILQQNIKSRINDDYQSIEKIYESMDGSSVDLVVSIVNSKRIKGEWWQLETLNGKKMDQFYNAWWSFFLDLVESGLYHFVPRYPFDADKQWTGTAVYNKFKKRGLEK